MRRLLFVSLLIAPSFAADWGKSSTETSWGKTSAEEVPVGKRLSVTAPILVGDLALYPVIDREAGGRANVDALALGQAMSTGQVQVQEMANGVVSQLVLVNHGDDPVMVMAGDVVHGGMQDRVIQQSLLVAGGGSIRVPVQCVERGRWTDRYAGSFAYAGRVDPTIRNVVQRAGSQDATWAAVAAANRARGVGESSSWLAGRQLDTTQLATAERELKARFEDDKRVVGVVVARGGRFMGSEVYAHPDLFARDRLQLLSSHLAGPMVARSAVVPSATDAAAFLEESF